MARHQEDGLDGPVELPVDQRHLKLVFKVRRSSEPSNHRLRLAFPGMVHEESIERLHANALEPPGSILHHFDSMGKVEQRPFTGVRGDGHDHGVKYLKTAGDDVGVAVRDGIEGAGIHPDFHGVRVPAASDP